MKTLREYINEAKENGVAIGHFNISNLEIFHGIYNAAKKLNVPIIIGLSEGEANFVGYEEASALVKAIRNRDNCPIFLNADHHYSFESVKHAINAGFDAVIIDAVKLPLEENISITKKCVDYASEISKKENRDILVEGELGFIGTSSKILDELPEGASKELTRPDEAQYFVNATGIDLLAASVGNIHGMVAGGNPSLRQDVIKSISASTGVPLVLHGGSGISDQDFIEGIKNGISIIHINTEIRIAFKEALRKSVLENTKEIAPYKYLASVIKSVEEVVTNRLKLFNMS